MASPTLVTDPSDVARRVVEYNLRVVWRGSQRVNLSVCIYVCDCKMWWNCGWRWDNKAIPFKVFCLTYLVTCNKKIFNNNNNNNIFDLYSALYIK
jgi:hypothetical protein